MICSESMHVQDDDFTSDPGWSVPVQATASKHCASHFKVCMIQGCFFLNTVPI